MKSVQLFLSTILLQYRQSHHILSEYVTVVDIGDPNQQKVEFIDKDRGEPNSGEASTLNLWGIQAITRGLAYHRVTVNFNR